MKTVMIRTVITIDGVEQETPLFSMDCSEYIAGMGDELSDSEIQDIIENDEELNPHYRY